MPSPFVLFDLDNTLYSPYSGVMPEMNRRMTVFVSEYFGIGSEEAVALRRGKPEIFGTTLQWLRVCHNLSNPEPYIEAVHPQDMENWVNPDPVLRRFLLDLPVDFALFTNSPIEHAKRTLAALELTDLFPDIWDLRRLGYRGKPDRISYTRILGDLGLRARDTILVDDSKANLDAFSVMGGRTVSAVNRTSELWMPELSLALGA